MQVDEVTEENSLANLEEQESASSTATGREATPNPVVATSDQVSDSPAPTLDQAAAARHGSALNNAVMCPTQSGTAGARVSASSGTTGTSPTQLDVRPSPIGA
jgi:hypothetical protein